MEFAAGDSINTSRGGWNFQDIDPKDLKIMFKICSKLLRRT